MASNKFSRFRIKCLGGCLSRQSEHEPEPEVIDMSCKSEDFLQLNDYTTNDANLMPMLPDEVKFHRVDNFHCRSLTIVDTSPIAVRRFADLTRELGKVKAPIVVELPQKLPFDLNDVHPFIESHEQTWSDTDTRYAKGLVHTNLSRDCNSTGSNAQGGIAPPTDDACSNMAQRTYQIERSRIEGRQFEKQGNGSLEWSLSPRQSEENVVAKDNRRYDSIRNIAYGGQGIPSPDHNSPASCEGAIPMTTEEQLPTYSSPTGKIIGGSGIQPFSGPGVYQAVSDAGTPTRLSNTNSKEDGPQKLYHVSDYGIIQSVEYYSPFDDNSDEEPWLFIPGSQIWPTLVGGQRSLSFDDSIDITMEGSISNVFSKEELSAIRSTIDLLPRSEISSIVKSAINAING